MIGRDRTALTTNSNGDIIEKRIDVFVSFNFDQDRFNT